MSNGRPWTLEEEDRMLDLYARCRAQNEPLKHQYIAGVLGRGVDSVKKRLDDIRSAEREIRNPPPAPGPLIPLHQITALYNGFRYEDQSGVS